MTNATSAAGLALIQQYEGFRAEPTRLPDGAWVVGYGHVRVGDAGEAVTQSEAADVLALDLAPYERLVAARVTHPINQSQFDALVSFAFSVGAEAFEQSQVLRRVNAGDFVSAACAMDAWRKGDVGGEVIVVDALVRRRAAEKALFLRDLEHAAAPSVFMRAKLDYAASVLGAPVKYAPAPDVRSVANIQVAPEKVAQEVAALTVANAAAETPTAVDPAQRIVEILKSEPATELLLTQVVVADGFDDDGEIVTAHAKPVARTLDSVRDATRRAYEEKAQAEQKKWVFPWFKRDDGAYHTVQSELKPDRRIRNMRRRSEFAAKLPHFGVNVSMDFLGLTALLTFGLGLMALGGSLLFDGRGDVVAIATAAALVTPGLAATLMAAFGLWRGPQQRAA